MDLWAFLEDICDLDTFVGTGVGQLAGCLKNKKIKLRRWVVLIDTSNNQLRLYGGRDESEGRLEVLFQGQWGTVCDDGFDLTAAVIACRNLGYRCSVLMLYYMYMVDSCYCLVIAYVGILCFIYG